MGSVKGHDDGISVETHITQDHTTNGESQQGSALVDDEHFIRKSEEELGGPDGRVDFIWRVVRWLLFEVECLDCPRKRELWLRVIEGDDDDDDLWLWVDGDEKWLSTQRILHWETRPPFDRLSAQSALRRRIARKRYPPATARNEKVPNATPEQRAYAIAWLIASSKGVAEFFASHGRTPPTLRIPHIARKLSVIIDKCWDASSQTDDWVNALTRSKEDGCKCSPADFRSLRKWFDLMVWLEDRPPALVVGDEPCVRCRSLLKSRFEEVAAKFTAASHVSLLDVFYDYCNYEGRVALSPPLSPTARLQVVRILQPLMKRHGYDVRYLLPVNRYPEYLQPRVLKLLCGSHISGQDGLPISGLPDDIFADANDPWVVVGITFDRAIAGKDADLHDHWWHNFFSRFLRCFRECFDMPVLPRLSSTGLALCRALDYDYTEKDSLDRDFCTPSDWVKSDQDGRQLRLTTAVIVAVTTFLRNKDVDFQSCRRCQAVCMEFFAGIPSTVEFGVASSGDRDNALEGPPSSPLQGSVDLGMQEPTGMEAFTSILHNSTLSKDEMHSQVTEQLHRLRQYLESCGLDVSDFFHRSDGGSRPCLVHVPDHGISSSKLSKSDKVEQIKDKLLEMLREHDLPYDRLPWYTLEKDLKKHGCTLFNWPAGVLRKRGNRGIHDLSAVEVNSLYEAIVSSDESRRLRICRCSSTLTVVPVQPVNNIPAAASISKRSAEKLDSPGHPSKRIRFKDMTSKVSQQHPSDLQADGPSDA